MPLPSLAVLMVTFNRYEYTRRTIDSLLPTLPAGTPILIIDNNSDDPQMREYLYALGYIENLEIIVNDENKGWGAAINEGLSLLPSSQLILLSNNDVEYKEEWFRKSVDLYTKYLDIGILGLWKHTAHAIRNDRGDFVVKDDIPGVAWLMKPIVLQTVGAFPERGPCATKGGNGEDTEYAMRVQQAGYVVGGPQEDLAVHIDGY